MRVKYLVLKLWHISFGHARKILEKKVLISKCIYLIINAIEPFEQGGTIT